MSLYQYLGKVVEVFVEHIVCSNCSRSINNNIYIHNENDSSDIDQSQIPSIALIPIISIQSDMNNYQAFIKNHLRDKLVVRYKDDFNIKYEDVPFGIKYLCIAGEMIIFNKSNENDRLYRNAQIKIISNDKISYYYFNTNQIIHNPNIFTSVASCDNCR